MAYARDHHADQRHAGRARAGDPSGQCIQWGLPRQLHQILRCHGPWHHGELVRIQRDRHGADPGDRQSGSGYYGPGYRSHHRGQRAVPLRGPDAGEHPPGESGKGGRVGDVPPIAHSGWARGLLGLRRRLPLRGIGSAPAAGRHGRGPGRLRPLHRGAAGQ